MALHSSGRRNTLIYCDFRSESRRSAGVSQLSPFLSLGIEFVGDELEDIDAMTRQVGSLWKILS
jgi:hypothetical protein